ncbi:MAG: (d)CMP kinase [Clostridia bacterium]|nr:(d)CMP kinase [Clostridia bacterium]
MIVAVDGPAGSGKGTITKIIANRLKLMNLDTGATYRCVALASLRKNIDINDEAQIIDEIDNLQIEFKEENGQDRVFLNGEDVSKLIRSTEVTGIVSQISAIIGVRLKLVDLQRKIAEGKDVILEGRDIGTYVFPNADVKIYLDATPEVRAERRYKENIEKGIKCTFEEVLDNINFRDKNDMSKKVGALKKADDAVVIDSSEMSIDEVANKMEEIIINSDAWRRERC